MKGTFLDNDRKVRESKRSGSGVEQSFKPKWPLYSRLQFLKKTIYSAQSLSNFEPTTPHLSSQSQSQNISDYQDFNDTIQSSHISPRLISCDIEEDIQMQFYYDKPSHVIIIYTYKFNVIYDMIKLVIIFMI